MIINPGNYLVFGRTGCGKSSFINSLAQADLAPIDNFKVCTKELTKYNFEGPLGNYQITDIPGFCEDENQETDKNYLNMAEKWLKKDENNHILFFCKFFDTRIRTEDHLICEYLAYLLKTFRDKNIQISLIASFADFNKSKLDFERGFRITRLRYLILIDYYCGLHYSKIKDFKKLNDLVDKYGYNPKELDDYLYEDNLNLFNGFFNSYAINNLLGIYKSQWNEINITPKEGFKFMFYSDTFDSNRSFLTNHEIFEDILGLKIEDILNWLGVRRETRRFYEYKEDPKPFLKYVEITNLILNLSKSSTLKSFREGASKEKYRNISSRGSNSKKINSENFSNNSYSIDQEKYLIQTEKQLKELTKLFDEQTNKNEAYNEILTNPDILAEYTIKFFGEDGPYSVKTFKNEKYICSKEIATSYFLKKQNEEESNYDLNKNDSKSASILIVEPHPILRKVLLERIRQDGHIAAAVGSETEAIDLSKEKPPDLLVSAEILEKNTAMTLAEQLGCYVIVLTARSGVEAIVNLLDEGADDVLRKPFALEELAARCRKIINEI